MKSRMKLTMRVIRLMALALLLLIPINSAPRQASATGPSDYVGWPTADETDGRFIDISGPIFNTQYFVNTFFIGLPGDATSFDVDIYDGDAGFYPNKFDVMFTSSTFTYKLIRDPLMNGSGTSVVASKLSTDFTNSAWAGLVSGQAVDSGAKAPSGAYFYRLEVSFNGNSATEAFLNGYKVRARQIGGSSGAQIAINQRVTFIGAPINTAVDPALNTAGNTYAGDWNFFPVVSQVAAMLNFTDTDADYRLDASAPGSPADDNTNLAIKVSPDIQYEIFSPSGALINYNTDPSGNIEAETWSYAPVGGAAAGAYRWHWIGVDAGNTVTIQSDYLMFSQQCSPCLHPYEVGDTVWLDSNGNGVQDAGEAGIAGVVVNLLDNGGNLIATATTDGGGQYMFTVDPGTYSVAVAGSNFQVGGALAGYFSSTGGNQQTKTVVDANVLSYDFGYYPPASLGDLVWVDTNGNGIQDGGEAGLAGVTVNLLDSGGNVIGTTTTNGSGGYSFSGLMPGSYSVQFVAPGGYNFSPANQGGDATKDSDANVTTGKSGAVTLGIGESNTTVDAGLYQPATLGDFVWVDSNANGVQD
ncbi:MAG: carboxypeptidase regulatory-like domain-containing protein, partial [Chloroflexi bacterium]|nr:carboxypeptidase regulatory-like domain-containing protein [Chloroflexota bacterium]